MLRFIGRSELDPDQLKALDTLLDEVVSAAAQQHTGDRKALRTDLAYLLFEEASRGPTEPAKLKATVLRKFSERSEVRADAR
jgi:hypothetical protein